jgi:ankyrin repeat protein
MRAPLPRAAGLAVAASVTLLWFATPATGQQERLRVHIAGDERPIDRKLFDAIRKGDAKEVSRLLSKGANANATEANDWPASVTAASQTLELVKLLVAKGAKIDARQSDQGWTPLTQAITNRRDDIVEYLLQKGPPQAQGRSGCAHEGRAARDPQPGNGAHGRGSL